MRARTLLPLLLLSLAVGSGRSGLAAPQDAKPAAAPRADAADLPAVPEGVQRLLDAPYLSEDERRDKRIFFGRYGLTDLNTPERAARAALVRGAYADPALEAAGIDVLDAAEARLLRGDLESALGLLRGDGGAARPSGSARAAWIEFQALALQGKQDDAVSIADDTVRAVLTKERAAAEDVVHVVRLIAGRIRLRGPVNQAGDGALDFHALMSMLADVRTREDRFYWPAILAEAELLYAKDNRQQAAEAVGQVLELNPTSAAAWALLGRLLVDGFQFDKAETIAARLDLLAGEFDVDQPDGGEGRSAGVSVQGAVIIARAMLRQSEGAMALEALAPALNAFPRSPELHAIRCAAEAVRFDFDAAEGCLAEYDRTFGKNSQALMVTGAALAESRQYAPAADFLARAHERTPLDPEPLIALGLLQIQAGKDAEALAALEKAFAVDPFNVRADNSLRLVRELLTYERIETEHFVIRFKKTGDAQPAPDEILAREMPAIMEQIHRVVAGKGPGSIDHEPQAHGQPKTIIDLMPNHEWFGVRIAGMPAIHTIAASTGPIIAMESPREGPKQSGPYDWVRVVRHEYVHTVTLSRTKNRIPHWFTEAAAVHLELAPRDYSTVQLLTRALTTGTLFDFQQINVAFVRPKKPSDRSQAYAQGHWMYQYIVETFGDRAPLDLMDRYAQGDREEEAFVRVLGTTREQFMRGFTSWAWSQVRQWGMLPADDVPTVRQLLATEALNAPDANADRVELLRRIAAGEDRLGPSKANGDAAADEDAHSELADVDLPQPDAGMIAAWLERHPNHPDVLELAVDEGIASARKPDQSIEVSPELQRLLERYAAARPVDPKPHRLLAKMYLDRAAQSPSAMAAEAARAIPHLEFLDQREQRTPLYAMELARRYAAVGDLTKARASAERATQIAPFEPAPRELAATVNVQARQFEDAQRHLGALARIEPDREIHRKRLEALRKLREQSPMR